MDIRLVLDPNISTTGTHVVFIGKQKETESNIYVLDLSNGSVSVLLSADSFYPLAHPVWSTDGESVSFSGYSYQQQKTGIWNVQSGSDPMFVTDGQEATWSPDGSQLAVLSAISGTHEIKIVDATTGKSETIYRSNTASREVLSDVNWSPDGKTLAFVIAAEENNYVVSRLYRLDVNGENLQPLAGDPPVSVAQPRWVQQGDWIALLMGPGLDYRLNLVRADGRCIVSPLPELHDLISVDITNDGSFAVITSGTALYKLDLHLALAPKSLPDVLVCP